MPVTGFYGTTIINYDGTDVGPIYLRDIAQRNQLGGGRGIYYNGQDRYIAYGADATFLSTSDVMLSVKQGVIKSYVDSSSLRATIIGGVADQGDTGVQGVTGPSGGVTGSTGIQGRTGIQGQTGVAGIVMGVTSASTTPAGTVDMTSNGVVYHLLYS